MSRSLLSKKIGGRTIPSERVKQEQRHDTPKSTGRLEWRRRLARRSREWVEIVIVFYVPGTGSSVLSVISFDPHANPTLRLLSPPCTDGVLGLREWHSWEDLSDDSLDSMLPGCKSDWKEPGCQAKEPDFTLQGKALTSSHRPGLAKEWRPHPLWG
jgi:hypothetical protein